MVVESPETLAWWVTSTDLRRDIAQFTHDAKVAGDLHLPKPVRRYLRDLEDTQACAMADMRRKPTAPTGG
jgi:hypothetical protein